MTAAASEADVAAGVLEGVEAEVWADWLEAAPPTLAARLGIRAVRSGGSTAGMTAACDLLAFNRAVGIGTVEPAAEAQIEELCARYDRAGVVRWMIQWCPCGRPADMPELLRARGFYHHDNWMKLVRRAADPLPPLGSLPVGPPAGTRLSVRLVGQRERMAAAAIFAEAFGWPADIAAWTAGLAVRLNWRVYMALEDATPVATALFFVCGRSAWLGFGATRHGYQQHGAQCALIDARVRAAAELGCDTVVAEAVEDRPDRPSAAYHNMRRLGFRLAYARPNFVRLAGTG
jgi:hypothetical protein